MSTASRTKVERQAGEAVERQFPPRRARIPSSQVQDSTPYSVFQSAPASKQMGLPGASPIIWARWQGNVWFAHIHSKEFGFDAGDGLGQCSDCWPAADEWGG
jgi:hypothetical protein